MPPLASVPGVAQFKVFMSQGGQQILNIHHVSCAGDVTPWTTADLNTMSTAIWNNYQANGVPFMSSTLALGDVQATDLGSVTGASGSHIGSAVGGDSGQPISQGSAACINWLIGRHYRGGHPRTYFPGLTVNAIITSTQLGGTYTGHLDTFANDLLSAISGASLARSGTPSLVCVHRFVNKVELVSPLVDSVQGHIVQGRICSQRKRLV